MVSTTLSSLDSNLNYENFILNNNKATEITASTVDSSTKSILSISNSTTSAVQNTSKETENVLKSGVTNEEVKQLQNNLKKLGFFTGDITGYYGDVTVYAVENFQKSNNMPINGIADKGTIDKVNYFATRAIYVASRGDDSREEQSKATPTPAPSVATTSVKKTAAVSTPKQVSTPAVSKGGVSMLQWFGGSENVFSIGSVATVTDLNTGIVFRVKRSYGYNHADCEALTAADTAAMKKAAGGSWNWTRRPVIVDVNGQRIAASLAPFPHAGRDDMAANITVSNRSGDYGTGDNLDAVKGNNMDGHFDIHFLGSKTHGTNKVDANHQAAVKRAYELSN